MAWEHHKNHQDLNLPKLRVAKVKDFDHRRKPQGSLLKSGYLRNWIPGIGFTVINSNLHLQSLSKKVSTPGSLTQPSQWFHESATIPIFTGGTWG